MSLYQSARKKKSTRDLEKRMSFYLPSKPQSETSLQQSPKKAEEAVAQEISYPGKVCNFNSYIAFSSCINYTYAGSDN